MACEHSLSWYITIPKIVVFSCGWVFLSVLHYLQRGKTREYREQFLFSRLCLICIPVNGSLDERRRWFLVGVYYLEQL